MAYTRVWDETFPPDTQAANLLGQDIRNFKDDIRERVASFGAGLFANRPTPENVFTGVTYAATDTKKIYRWNGASWDDISNVYQTSFTANTNIIVIGAATIQSGITFVAASGSPTISFPVAFSGTPGAITIAVDTNTFQSGMATIGGGNSTGFRCFNNVLDITGITPVGIFLHWIAMGPT